MKSSSRDISIGSFAVAVLLVRIADGGTVEYLMLKRAEETLKGEWCHVAGCLEPGEKAWEAALREVREETGLVPVTFYSTDYCEQFYEVKREMMSQIFEANVKLRKRIVSQG